MKILQVFNRYLEYGGEEGSVGRIAGTLRQKYELVTFYGSTDEILAKPLGRLRMPVAMLRNDQVLRRLRETQLRWGFDFWQIHNVFPAVSVAAYDLAIELEVPVIQYLHNYRFGCAGANYLRDGRVCLDCSPGRFGPALRHRCWRGSLPATVAMVLALRKFWKLGAADPFAAFIAISRAQKDRHVAMGFPEEKIAVLPHFLEAGAEPTNAPPKGGGVLFLGRVTEEKGVELLLRAWARVDAGNRRLRIVGDGPDLGAMKRVAEELGLRNVEFPGFVPREEHAGLWKDTALFVAPSIWEEPFGMVVLEAWKEARPVLATRLGSFPEMIDDGVDGWLAEPEVEAFAEVLQRALAADHESMGRAGRQKLQERFGRELWLSRIGEIYDKAGVLAAARECRVISEQ